MLFLIDNAENNGDECHRTEYNECQPVHDRTAVVRHNGALQCFIMKLAEICYRRMMKMRSVIDRSVTEIQTLLQVLIIHINTINGNINNSCTISLIAVQRIRGLLDRNKFILF